MALKVADGVFAKIDERISEMVEKAKERFIVKFTEAGRILVDTAISRGNYEDRTGNLRDSIGFMVTMDGQSVSEQFSPSYGGDLARDKAINQAAGTTGLMLIVIVGMKYGIYVESQGFDVLSSAGQIANKLIPKLLKE